MNSEEHKITFHTADTEEAQSVLKEILKHHNDVGLDEADIMVVIGGDGTMLEALHKVHDVKIPVYGINSGSIGFLLNPSCSTELNDKLNNAHEVDIYPLEMIAKDQDGKEHKAMAFNEVSLLRETRQAAKLKISVDDVERIAELICDGILLSTPAGSTAYNLSANGPIIPLSGNVLALTPISAFRPRRWRGALLPSHANIKIDIINNKKRPVSATADSTEIRDIKSVTIKQANSHGCKLLFDPDHNLEERILKEQFEA